MASSGPALVMATSLNPTHFLKQSLAADAVHRTVDEYADLHDRADVDTRRGAYATMVNAYYDLVTDFYEYGWGQSFHFAPRYRDESFEASLARHQHFLALRLGLASGMTVLDAGCGVGGPARSIARFSGAHVVGLNNNAYQVKRATELTGKAGLADVCRFEHGDFMDIQAPDATYDAAFGIESTAHAPDKVQCFREIYRVLRPGGRFAVYEWCLTDAYDPSNLGHRAIKAGIERGNGLPDIAWTREVVDAMTTVGFDVVCAEDRAHSADPQTPWYKPLSGTGYRPREVLMKPAARKFTHGMMKTLERVGLVSKGTEQVCSILNKAAEALVAGGEQGVFTPMFFVCGQKPR